MLKTMLFLKLDSQPMGLINNKMSHRPNKISSQFSKTNQLLRPIKIPKRFLKTHPMETRSIHSQVRLTILFLATKLKKKPFWVTKISQQHHFLPIKLQEIHRLWDIKIKEHHHHFLETKLKEHLLSSAIKLLHQPLATKTKEQHHPFLEIKHQRSLLCLTIKLQAHHLATKIKDQLPSLETNRNKIQHPI